MLNSKEVLKYTGDLSILYVEDHNESRIATTEILKRLFKTVDSCVDGKNALDSYLSFNKKNLKNYDIVFSDIQMPVMDGITLAEEILKLNPSQLIIILSAHDEEEYLLKLINLRVEKFIHKPIVYNELLECFLDSAKKLQTTDTPKIETTNIGLAKGIRYSTEMKSIDNAGEKIPLTKFEIIFLEFLLSSSGKICSNEEIVSHYTSLNETIDTSNIRKLVSKLRKKLPLKTLESIYSTGYKLTPYTE